MNNKKLILASEICASIPEAGGAFLVCGEKPNAMVIGWWTMGVMWKKVVFSAPVRKSRFTHELLEKSSSFTVCVPNIGQMKEALALCGTKSGRDMDKLAALGINTKKAASVDGHIIEGCKYAIECKIISKADMNLAQSDKAAVVEPWYPNADEHTYFYGEIIECYQI